VYYESGRAGYRPGTATTGCSPKRGRHGCGAVPLRLSEGVHNTLRPWTAR